MGIAFFDLDGTLLKGASAEIRFARLLFRKGYLRAPQCLSFFWYAVRHLVPFRKNKAYLKNLPVYDLCLLAEKSISQSMQLCCRNSVVSELQKLQQKGKTTVLLTGAPQFLAEIYAKKLGFTHCFGSVLKIAQGCFCGEVPLIHPFGEEKLSIAKSVCKKYQYEISSASAYADSIHDSHLLNHVGEPVLVAPDRKLKKLGQSKGWRILDLYLKASI